MDLNIHQCRSEEIAAYMDGQLDRDANIFFEEHVQECHTCNAELNAQRSFMCELDAALASTPDLPLPRDFARIVAARAESDMRGLRDRKERRLALRLTLLLLIVSSTLLGATAIRSLFYSGRSVAQKILGVVDLLWKTLHDATIGLTIVARVLGRTLVPESHFASLLSLSVLVLGVLTLTHLIFRYHRQQRMRLFE
ncbi:MAG: zf-HC2 domain-containing protein [Acidobacteriota bacterium]